jgi:hypothetical protein
MGEQYRVIPMSGGRVRLMKIPNLASDAGLTADETTILYLCEQIEALQEKLSKAQMFANHISGCAHNYGHDCDCGLDEFRNK